MKTGRIFSLLLLSTAKAFVQPPCLSSTRKTVKATALFASSSSTSELVPVVNDEIPWKKFNLATALFCGGLAFDAYTEPPSNSSRWERGSKGMNVAFVSAAFTRSLYKGLVEVTPIRCTDLPDEDDTAEGLLSGGGADAYLLVAAIEGNWKEDVDMLQKEAYHDGVLGLIGAAHVGKSRTAWSNVNVHQSTAARKKTGRALPYHIPSTWGKGGQAVWDDEPPFYLYVQDPATARLVFTVMDDDVVSGGSPVGSAHRKLTDLIPLAKYSGKELVDRMKGEVLQKIKSGDIDALALSKNAALKFNDKGWTGEIKLTSKPRKKDKNSQMAMGAAAGAMVGGPVGAAVGGLLGSMYEGQVRGRVELKLRYLPIPQVDIQRQTYTVKGGLPGVNWGEMYERFIARHQTSDEDGVPVVAENLAGSDLEHCFFINHDETGGCCAVFRSLEKRLIVVSFRGTCVPKDLITDASIAQTTWMEGDDVKNDELPKVHTGFRKSMDSIARRLKELILATVGPGEEMSQYDMLVTGHSLGGALATLFVMDVAESGIDAGRALPQTDPSDAWWKSIASTFMGNAALLGNSAPPPPRPKSLKMYNFGSPRVGNDAFAAKFESLRKEGYIDEAYRVVNGEDLVARNPRTINALAFGSVGYEHCGATVLVSMSSTQGENDAGDPILNPKIWVEGESDDSKCPVRDGTPLTSPLADGSLLGDLYKSTQAALKGDSDVQKSQAIDYASAIKKLASSVTDRLQTVSATDITGMIGIDPKFTEREMRMIQSIMKGEALKHHMEDEYYGAIGRACGFIARVGEELVEVVEEKNA